MINIDANQFLINRNWIRILWIIKLYMSDFLCGYFSFNCKCIMCIDNIVFIAVAIFCVFFNDIARNTHHLIVRQINQLNLMWVLIARFTFFISQYYSFFLLVLSIVSRDIAYRNFTYYFVVQNPQSMRTCYSSFRFKHFTSTVDIIINFKE